tara:strand:- start:3298 stop:3723 length:426 start_codon:yes stop_codon:yes gene_type:complete
VFRRQLQLFESPSDDVSAAAVWVTGSAVSREGLAAFVHIIRSPRDPERLSRSERKGSETTWKADLRASSKGAWLERIGAHLADGVPRTFNRIVLEVSGYQYTADVAFKTAADEALWELVAAEQMEHTLAAPILFRATQQRT